METQIIRLSKVAKELNVGKDTLIECLKRHGHEVDPNPNTKITPEQYDILMREFAIQPHTPTVFAPELQQEPKNLTSMQVAEVKSLHKESEKFRVQLNDTNENECIERSPITISYILARRGGSIEEICDYANQKGILLPMNADYVLSKEEIKALDPLLAKEFEGKNKKSKKIENFKEENEKVKLSAKTKCSDTNPFLLEKSNKIHRKPKNIENNGIIGIVNWFDQDKGYGVITSYFEKKEYFVHERSIDRNAQTNRLVADIIVLFIPFFDEKRKRDSVEDVVVVEDYQWVCQVVDMYRSLFDAETSQNETGNKVSGFVEDIVSPSLIQWLSCSLKKDDTSNEIHELLDVLERYDFPSSFSKQFLKVFLALKHKSIFQRHSSDNTFLSIYEDLFFKLFDSYDSEIVYEIWNSSKGKAEGEFLIPLCYYLHNHKGFSEYLCNTLVVDNVVSFVKQLIKFICRIEREEMVSSLMDNNALITNPDFITSSKGCEILNDFYEFVFDEKNEELLICLYKENYIDNIDVAQICNSLSLFSINDLKELYSSKRIIDESCTILGAKIKGIYAEYQVGTSLPGLSHQIAELLQIGFAYRPDIFDVWSIEMLHKMMEEGEQKTLDFFCDYLALQIEEFLGDRYKVWQKSFAKTLDERGKYILWDKNNFDEISIDYLSNLLQHEEDDYKKLKEKFRKGRMSEDSVKRILLDYFGHDNPIKNRMNFQRALQHIKLAIDLSFDDIIEQIKSLNSDFYNLILWLYGRYDSFEFGTLCSKFIYFSPKDQVLILKKLFYLADVGRFDLDVERLSMLIRIDNDLYNEISKLHPTIPIDISTDVVIKCLQRLSKEGTIIYDKDVLACIITASLIDKEVNFHIGSYFDNCTGRYEYKWDGYRTQNGKIETLSDNLYKVTVFTNVQKREYTRGQGWHYETRHNECFDGIIKAIGNLPGRKWNQSQSYWEVPLDQKDNLVEIAKQYGLTIEGTGNYHMSIYTPIESGCPSGISYCEGRMNPTKHHIHDKFFLWCRNSRCFRDAVTYHKCDDWQNYTLLDFCRILNINMDSKDDKGRIVKHGKYLIFSSIINRINKLVDHLYCRECNEVLQPGDISDYHTHLVTHFRCTNPQCHHYYQSIYISKCFNWKCNEIIDQRDSKACPNQWYICSNCGSCCSNRTAEQRIENLKTLGQPIPRYWYDFLYNRMGHLEKREFYCYKCGERAMSIGDGKFSCNSCGVTYDRKQFDYQPSMSKTEYQPY